MGDQQYLLSNLAGIFHTGVFCLQEDQFVSYEENPQYNPLYNNESFRLMLLAKMMEENGLRWQFITRPSGLNLHAP